ncbi:shikimate kinase, partial [Xylella fastidiosa subsp. multiplex]|nr:shikimate kinase [Xylella fastidiosa subsp. multiplex]
MQYFPLQASKFWFAGKSSIGRRIAKHFNLHFADTDHAIVERAGTSISTIFKYSGEPEFRRLE